MESPHLVLMAVLGTLAIIHLVQAQDDQQGIHILLVRCYLYVPFEMVHFLWLIYSFWLQDSSVWIAGYLQVNRLRANAGVYLTEAIRDTKIFSRWVSELLQSKRGDGKKTVDQGLLFLSKL